MLFFQTISHGLLHDRAPSSVHDACTVIIQSWWLSACTSPLSSTISDSTVFKTGDESGGGVWCYTAMCYYESNQASWFYCSARQELHVSSHVVAAVLLDDAMALLYFVSHQEENRSSPWDGSCDASSGLFLLVLQTHSIQQSLAEYNCLFLLFVYYLFVLATSRFHRRHNESSRLVWSVTPLPSMIIEMVLAPWRRNQETFLAIHARWRRLCDCTGQEVDPCSVVAGGSRRRSSPAGYYY